MAAKPTPGADTPVINPTGQMNQSWYEYFQSLLALLNSTIATLAALPASPTIDGVGGDFTLGYALSRSSQVLSAALTPISGALGADVNLNNTANYFTGPSVAQGSTGTWFVTGTVTVTDTVSAHIYAKLWDGTTLISSGAMTVLNNDFIAITLSGIITSPAGNLRISVRDFTTTNGKILFNATGNSKDSHITAVRIA